MKKNEIKCVALIGCSDFDIEKDGEKILKIKNILQYEFQLKVKVADSLFSLTTIKEKAIDLNSFFNDREIDIIFDISGGDSANNIIDFIDYNIVKKSRAVYAGYSDNTVIINSIYKKSGKYSYYYNINNLIGNDSLNQKEYFKKKFIEQKDSQLSYKFLKNDKIQGIVIGGNVRCFLKLAGTKYFPDYNNKILFLESFSGNKERIISYFYQLKQIGIFKKINGLIFGEFTQLKNMNIKIEDIVMEFLKDYKFPILKTDDLGHQPTAKAIVIGTKILLS